MKSPGRSFNRMKLLSMIPLSTGIESQAIAPVSALERKAEPYQGTYSTHTENIDHQLSAFTKKDHHYKLTSPEENNIPKYKPSPYKPQFEKTSQSTPTPISYTPQYEACLPSVQITTLPPKNQETPQKSLQETNTSTLVSQFYTSLRDFDLSNFVIPERYYPDVEEQNTIEDTINKSKTRPTPELISKVGRTVIINDTPAKHIAPADPIPEKEPVVPIISRQKERVGLEVKEDKGLNYPKAIEQLDKMKPRTKTTSFDQQVSREKRTSPNKRVAFLDQLAAEQKRFIKELSRGNSVQERGINQDSDFDMNAKKRRPATTFEKQRPRQKDLFPDQKKLHQNSRWPESDPIQNYLKLAPRVRTVTIRPAKKPLSDIDFWHVTDCHRK